MNVPAVETDALTYRYTTRRDGFTLTLDPLLVQVGEHLAIIGPSGSGKSTLASLLAGILVPQKGSVRVGGTELSALSDRQRRDFRVQNIGFVFQQFELLAYLRGFDNLTLPYRINPALKLTSEVKSRARDLADRLGIAHLLKRHPHRMSQGERQRLAIARALLPQPTLIIADEPTGNLDPATTDITINLLRQQAREQQATLLLITHDPSLPPTFDRVLDMGRSY